ncbi:retinoic acid-induced protein 3-like [Hoplias malabaricus]|uniref:retinoic acid-induced protein 3-like n=1 Tax=Hoplias malabaricus TaxID=27720 RepID=UPI0034634FDA
MEFMKKRYIYSHMDLQNKTHFFLLLIIIIILALSGGTLGQNSTGSNSTGSVPFGCGSGLSPEYYYLCDLHSVWGIVVQALTVLGFLISLALLLGVLLWCVCVCGLSRCGTRSKLVHGSACVSTALFLLAVAGIFALPYAFIVGLTTRTCPVRVFLFGVLFSLAFACLLARTLVVLGWRMCEGWAEPCVAIALALVQVVIAVEWLLVVLVRDGLPCSYSQEEFVMLQIYVMVLLAIAMVMSLCLLSRGTMYSSQLAQYYGRLQGALPCLTLLLSAAIWVVWITLLTWGNRKIGRRPVWDDPVISIALTANGWVLLLGHGLNQVRFVFCGQRVLKNQTPDFTGWTSPMGDMPGLHNHKDGTDNLGYQHDRKDKKGKGKGKGEEPVLRSPYDTSFSMTEIDPDKDYTIPRPQTTNMKQPYDDYYGRRLS